MDKRLAKVIEYIAYVSYNKGKLDERRGHVQLSNKEFIESQSDTIDKLLESGTKVAQLPLFSKT
jgi:hypothetical protein